MHEPNITIVGNVARVPKLRTVAGGAFVADFRLAATPRRLDKSTGDWLDGQTLWFGVTCWRSLAENVSASLHSGDRVVVTGRLATRSWKGEDGVERQGLEVEPPRSGSSFRAVRRRSCGMAAAPPARTQGEIAGSRQDG